jgi:hypothetical protein
MATTFVAVLPADALDVALAGRVVRVRRAAVTVQRTDLLQAWIAAVVVRMAADNPSHRVVDLDARA